MLTNDQSNAIAALILFAVVVLLLRILLKKEQEVKEYQIPPSHIRVQFTEANMKLPVGTNLGKQLILVEDGQETKYPYHPILLGIMSQMKRIPYIDETLGQDKLPDQVIGEINTNLPPTRVN